ncbi:hypothetical protein [Micromonospora sp. URMC 103]|uniref:hypothetical protein n=1 Tax=Micromonospora sp. URMC 103 TaxID=3423406 RepID=UPI003F1DDD26
MTAHRMDQDTVERLLDASHAASWDATHPDATHPLAPLLLAVRSAPLPGELDGEHAAVQAFRRALADPAGAPGRRRTLTSIAARAGLAALAFAATGGVALAATGTLPGGAPEVTTSPPASSAPSAPSTSGAGPSAGGGTGRAPTRGPDASARPTPAAALTGLCRAYRAEEGDSPGRALRNPAFAALVAAAGGPSRVADYCDLVLADEPPHGGAADRSQGPGRPGAGSGAPPTAPPGQRAEPTESPGQRAEPTEPAGRGEPPGSGEPGGPREPGGPGPDATGGTGKRQSDGSAAPAGDEDRGGGPPAG